MPPSHTNNGDFFDVSVWLEQPASAGLAPLARHASIIAGTLLAKVVLVHVLADLPALAGARILIVAEVDAAVDSRVVDVIGHLFEARVVQRDTGDAGVG
jgi:hypothetical protein